MNIHHKIIEYTSQDIEHASKDYRVYITRCTIYITRFWIYITRFMFSLFLTLLSNNIIKSCKYIIQYFRIKNIHDNILNINHKIFTDFTELWPLSREGSWSCKTLRVAGPQYSHGILRTYFGPSTLLAHMRRKLELYWSPVVRCPSVRLSVNFFIFSSSSQEPKGDRGWSG